MDQHIGYLRLEGIQGDSTEPRFPGSIELLGMQMGSAISVHGPGFGASAGLTSRLVCSGPHSCAEPRIQYACAIALAIKSGTLTWTCGGATIARLTLKDLLVDNFTSDSTSFYFSLSFRSIEEFLTPKQANDHLGWLVNRVRSANGALGGR